MNRHDLRGNGSSYVDWLILGFSAVSTIIYFVSSLSVRGEVLFLFRAVMKVLNRLGVQL